MKKRHQGRHNHRKRSFIKQNPAAFAFVAVLLATLAVGSIFLAISAARKSRVMTGTAQDGGRSSFSTRVPFAESIFFGTADAGEGSEDDGITTFDDSIAKDAEDSSYENGDPGSYWERRVETSGEGAVTLAFAGDILLDPEYAIMSHINQRGGSAEGSFGGSLLDYMRSADIMVINNEFSYSDRGTPTANKTFTFRAKPASASILSQIGVDVATLANNHSYDYGPDALLDTLDATDSVGIAHIGAGADIEEASHPLYFTSDDGIRIALIAATQIERLDNPDTKGATDTSPGVFRCLDNTRLLQKIREAKDTGAFVIVCIHWGTENAEAIDWWQQKQGPEMVDAGADLIVGAHPHILQKIDYIGGVPVVYSLGNFLFNSKTVDTGLLSVAVNADRSVSLRFIPALQSGCMVSEASGAEGARILGHMREISPAVSIDDEGNISQK